MFKVLFRFSLLLILSINAFAGPQDEIRISKCLDKSGFFKEHAVVEYEGKYYVFNVPNDDKFGHEFSYNHKILKRAVIDYVDHKLPKISKLSNKQGTSGYFLEVVQLLELPKRKGGKFDREIVLNVLSGKKVKNTNPQFRKYNTLCKIINYKEDIDQNCMVFRPVENSEQLVVAFSGQAATVFSFRRSLEKYPINVLFVRDVQSSWYLKGLDYNTDCSNVLKCLSEVIKKGNYKRVKFIGVSSGAWASIYFGLLLNVDEVCAFSPIFFASKRSEDYLYELIQSKEIYSKTKVNVHFSSSCKMDSEYARKIMSSRNICLCPYKGSNEHCKIGPLKETGAFDKIIKKFVGL